jgi:hypothetical protein
MNEKEKGKINVKEEGMCGEGEGDNEGDKGKR